ncbi:sensor histidine kinase [Burkholderia guangdongensis]|uniref:sensor histidine kinase n=1 Tax=Burkholderia guangdongensis TaxID=1792500 RepID=UPI0015CC6A62|nr:7TM diverse intracellular signaling domain-containing protein [Burkholderia guangdongensis]
MLLFAPWTVAHAAGADSMPAIVRVEAARAQTPAGWAPPDLRDDLPPASGWGPVALPDIWSARWPAFDGVVWYRLTWRRPSDGRPVAMMLDYLNMAGAIYLNGTLMRRDADLAEPLSREWNTPRYLLLPAALLHDGENTLLFRVSGMAEYQGGLGPVTLGSPMEIQARYERAERMRLASHWFSLAISVTLSCFFLAMWLMRRRETLYGWFGAMLLAWSAVQINQTATSTWPLSSTDGWEIANTIALLAYSALYTIFILRLCGRRWPRYERALWGAVVLASGVLLATPHARVENVRDALVVGQALHYFATSLTFLVYAYRNGNTEHRILAACVAIFVLAGGHDLLTLLGIFRDNVYYGGLTIQILTICMALVLGRRHLINLRRIEAFNDDLTRTVETTRRELTETLQRQHQLEVAHARLGERLSFAHNLHDGLGPTLVGSIIALERTPHAIPPHRFLSILKELRDDLRLIIDSTTSEQHGNMTLADQIASLRHRFTRLFETQDAACTWRLSGLEQCMLPSSRILDLIRILQEALTNVFKHSGASRVDVEIRADDGLVLVVRDNGIGFVESGDASHAGIGMTSMRARASRLGATLEVRSAPGETVVTLTIPRTRYVSAHTASENPAAPD